MKMKWLPVVEEDRSDDLGCASAECDGVPEWYAEAGAVGSYYCSECKSLIEQQSKRGCPAHEGDPSPFCGSCP